MWMLWLATSALAAPAWDRLDAEEWQVLGERRSEVGALALRTKRLDDVGCVEGSVVVGVPVHKLLAVTNDMVSSVEWSSNDLLISRELERRGHSMVLFQYFDTPGWTLAADRFWVIRGETERLGEGGRYRWNHLDSGAAFPEAVREARQISARAVEPPVNFGEWLFKPEESGTLLRYRACVDFGGRVPAGIQHRLNTQQVPNLIAELVLEAERR
jgi:hypothetical protein